MIRAIAVSCFAKLNLTFSILGLLPDGYHGVDTLYQSINLEDKMCLFFDPDSNLVAFSQNENKIPDSFPLNDDNLIIKAIKLYQAKINEKTGVIVNIEKNIPMAAGLAGGSADAAGALFAMNEYYQNRLSHDEMMALALQLGADVPFCLVGGSMRGLNKGEVLSPVQHQTVVYFLIAKPTDISLSTPDVFRAYDSFMASNTNSKNEIDTDAACVALSHGKIKKLCPLLGNDFESVVFEMHPQLKYVCDDMLDNSALTAHLTGSGPTVYGVFHDFIEADVALASLNLKFPNFSTWICTSAQRGVALMEPIR